MEHSEPGVSLKGLRKTGSIHHQGQGRQAGPGPGSLLRPMADGNLVGGTLPPQRMSGERPVWRSAGQFYKFFLSSHGI